MAFFKQAKNVANLTVKAQGVEELREMLQLLAKKEVLVGFPEDTTARAPDESGVEITNAALGYIHDKGSADDRIPARPFMQPGMMSVESQAVAQLTKMAKDVLARKGGGAIDQGFERLGLIVQSALRKKINEGIPPPLAESTLRERANRGGKSKGRQGANWELAWRAAGAPAGVELAKPLIDTGQLRNAINYVVRERTKRKK